MGGTITYSPDTIADFDLGTSATHECNDGFILRGNVIRVCEEGAPGSTVGIWSGTPPVCEREYLVYPHILGATHSLLTILVTVSTKNI